MELAPSIKLYSELLCKHTVVSFHFLHQSFTETKDRCHRFCWVQTKKRLHFL